MNLSNIVEWTGSAVVGGIVSMGLSYLCDLVRPADRKAELKRLQAALPKIRAVMGIAEALKIKLPDSCQWVEQLRHALETSEDVLDELEYKKLEDMVENRDEPGGSASSSKKRKRSTINDDTLKRLKEALTLLDGAAIGVEHLLQRANVLGISDLSESRLFGTDLRRETTSLLPVTMLGREVEKERIIGWLKRPTDARLSSFGIVGMGGQGKTTLVQFAYQEICGSNHFDKTIWVCVSTNFCVEEITRKILGELDETNYSGKPLNALQEILKKQILSKKVLLILDDVWNDDKIIEWEQLVAPLRFVREGSKILFTARMLSVVQMFARVIRDHEFQLLQGLPEGEFRLIFNTYAFHGFDHKNCGSLQAVGNQIIKMLRGNPLAAKVIGSLLNSCMELQYWRRILNHGSIFNLEQANDVVEVLKLSYYHLPADLQVCFRYCSIFPQDHLFDKNDLIKMWIASGFIRKELCQKERPEDIGEDYFHHLLRKSFFEYSYVTKGERYVMHDLLHDLAISVSEGECCRIEHSAKFIIPDTVRHVSIHGSQTEKVSHLENLRSLVITTTTEQTGADPDFVIPNNLIKKSLRLLKINGFRISELPGDISCLVHLRYLSIDNLSLLLIEPLRSLIPISYLYVGDCSGMEELPEQWLLQNRSTIRVLVIHDASSLKSLPETMARLTALEVLQISKANLLEELPELPASLRRLVIGDAHSLKSLPATMARLAALKNLRTLCFNNGNPDS